MAPSGRRSSRNKDGQNPAEQTGASFFKVILQSTVRDRRLLIPRKFVTDSASGLMKWKSATFRVGDGEQWEVGLVREGKEDVSFGNHGWERFAQNYSLEYGHSLLFTYRGRSNFSVTIFDRSCVEIDYPIRREAVIEDEREVDAAATMLKQEKKQGSMGEVDCKKPSSSSSSRKRRAC